MSATSYRHTQVGWVILIALSFAALGSLAPALWGSSTMSLAAFGILVVCLVLFPSLTVIGDQAGLEARFGLGPIRKRFKWSDIRSVAPVRNSWLAGWGIRWIGSGWMFNISGLDAVELRLKNGRVFRIGTDDPRGLHAFVKEHLERALQDSNL